MVNRPYISAPIQVSMIDENQNFHPSWSNYFEALTRQLNSTLTPNGNLMPAVDQLKAENVKSHSTQKIIYNSTHQSYQANINGTWETIGTVAIMSENKLNALAGTHKDRVQFIYDESNDEIYIVKGLTKFRLQKA